MAGDWIPFDHDFPEKPEVLAVHCRTGVGVGDGARYTFMPLPASTSAAAAAKSSDLRRVSQPMTMPRPASFNSLR